MEADIAAVTVLLILVGSMMALRGSDMLRGSARLLGGMFLGLAGSYLGFRIGRYFGGQWAVAYTLSLGILGFLVGALFGPQLLQALLMATVFVLGFTVGYLVADRLDGTGAVPLFAGLVVGLVVAWILSAIAKRLLLAATIILGSAMMGAGIFILLLGDVKLEHSAVLSFGAFIACSLGGFLVQRTEMSGPGRGG
ncbi:MAG: hypothetical protein JW939_01460 [Candidatus Thermoplasmatota archaeon]|nr:hypothetical protein [Candidatus Thermoplasmatota archaeon]